ncbi:MULTISPECIES: hypothetical protein [unclassified Streptomyces]|uniref:hypothetical protein n=1 Tax=unclassified Streptomyces TaxID=2593676 RepID=UPI0035DA9374
MPHDPTRTNSAHRKLDWVHRGLAAIGLSVDAYLHAHLAERYDAVSATISQGTLFRIEAALAALAALLVLVWRSALADVFAWAAAAGGLAALLLYRYVDVGELGPLPNMYEPTWFIDKNIAVAAQVVALIATTLLLLTRRRRRHLA